MEVLKLVLSQQEDTMPTSEMKISELEEVGLLDLFDDTRSLFRDVNEFFNKPEVLDFLIKTSVTVMSVTLVFLLFKLVVRGIFL